MRGGRRGGLWSEEEIASSGTGSERAQVRERSLRGPLREPGSPVAGAASRRSEGAMRPAIARRISPGTSLMALAAGRAGGGAAEGRGVRAELSGREVKRRLAGASQVERRSERPPSEDAEAGHGAPYRVTRQRARAQQPQGAPTPGGSGARVDLSPGTFPGGTFLYRVI